MLYEPVRTSAIVASATLKLHDKELNRMAMATGRRIGLENSTRAALLDAAAQLMCDEGYAAVTSRSLASAAGLKPQLVHYYFRTMDDLFLELLRHRAELSVARHTEALASPQPLWALWEMSNHTAGTTLIMEFVALSNHRKVIRTEIAAYAAQLRNLQAEALARAFAARETNAEQHPPIAISMLLASICNALVTESAMGVAAGHAETVQLVEHYLEKLEGPRIQS
jgi:AcrR family transcriptional regulator